MAMKQKILTYLLGQRSICTLCRVKINVEGAREERRETESLDEGIIKIAATIKPKGLMKG